MKKLLFIGFLFLTTLAFAQKNVNNYKYVVVPKKFDFLKEENQYRVNTFTKYQFEKAGFNAIYDDQKVADLNANPCLGLKANVIDDSGLFTTKMKVTLTNCQGDVVYTSTEGKSKIKDYEGAYQEALKGAFASIKGLNYEYDASQSLQTQVPEQPQPTKHPAPAPLEQETATVVVGSGVTAAAAQVNETTNNATETVSATKVESKGMLLYAQPIANGYQLVDTTPKVVFKITKTTQPNYYIIQGRNGFVYKKDGQWIAEYYEGETLKQEALNIKF
ncbi:hypothetical protein [Galbibacter mesophilus]|uniref:hypothetical protein n=1 Tax=Galbibacter mesophilus TaxID=379069 RepID=UPI00191E1067|nr:hypothetical protein [Galbibacter mesophilus]MCM5661756.1 hypothetical protein [Galbibacter mesophilus]